MSDMPIGRGEEFHSCWVSIMNTAATVRRQSPRILTIDGFHAIDIRGNQLQRWLRNALIVARRAKARRLHQAHFKYPRDRDAAEFKNAGVPVTICGEDQKKGSLSEY
jgi:hypothetical protein